MRLIEKSSPPRNSYRKEKLALVPSEPTDLTICAERSTASLAVSQMYTSMVLMPWGVLTKKGSSRSRYMMEPLTSKPSQKASWAYLATQRP